MNVIVAVKTDGDGTGAEYREDREGALQQGYRPPRTRLPVTASRNEVHQQHQKRQDEPGGGNATEYTQALK